MGVQAPPELLGIHTNMPNVIPLDIDKLAFSGAPAPSCTVDGDWHLSITPGVRPRTSAEW